MENKLIILVINLIWLNFGIACEKQDSTINIAKSWGNDIVICKFKEASDPENNWGINSVYFEAVEVSPSLRRHNNDDNFREMYELVAQISLHKIQTAFYKCMANLESPQTAVKYGEYRKCIKNAWQSRPLGAIDIQVYEKKYERKDIMAKETMKSRTFSWYDPIKSLSFLD